MAGVRLLGTSSLPSMIDGWRRTIPGIVRPTVWPGRQSPRSALPDIHTIAFFPIFRFRAFPSFRRQKSSQTTDCTDTTDQK